MRARQTGGGGSGGTYNGNSPTTVTVGGLPAGSNIAGMSIQDILQAILAPYVPPSFANFLMAGQSTSVEVGATISGTKNFSWTFTNSANVQPGTMDIVDVTNNTVLALDIPITSPGSAAVGTIQLTSPGSYSWRGRADNSLGTTFQSSLFTVTWFWRKYYGTSASTTLNAAGITGLASSALSATATGTYNFAAGNYKYFVWPDTFTSPTAATGFKDASTNLALAMADNTDSAFFSNVENGWYYGLVNVTNTFGITTSYRVYRTKNLLGSTLSAIVS